MAYVTIAGLPVEVGLYIALVPMVVYALLGSLRPISVSVSVTSTIVMLAARKDVLLGLVVTEAGIAATKVVSSPTDVAIFGIAADESGIVVAQAAATAEGVAYEVAATDGEDVAYEAGVATDEGAADVQTSADDQADDAADEA